MAHDMEDIVKALGSLFDVDTAAADDEKDSRKERDVCDADVETAEAEADKLSMDEWSHALCALDPRRNDLPFRFSDSLRDDAVAALAARPRVLGADIRQLRSVADQLVEPQVAKLTELCGTFDKRRMATDDALKAVAVAKRREDSGRLHSLWQPPQPSPSSTACGSVADGGVAKRMMGAPPSAGTLLALDLLKAACEAHAADGAVAAGGAMLKLAVQSLRRGAEGSGTLFDLCPNPFGLPISTGCIGAAGLLAPVVTTGIPAADALVERLAAIAADEASAVSDRLAAYEGAIVLGESLGS